MIPKKQAQKICPIMTNGNVINQGIEIVYSGVPCIKEQCMLWVTVVSHEPHIIETKSCAFALQARKEKEFLRP